jgi:phosphoenolpyruvate-protein phosphotransferase (PTS system enzyme I)
VKKSGIAIFDGVVCGKALIYQPYDPVGAEYGADRLSGTKEKLNAYEQALADAREELERIAVSLSGSAPEKTKIFQAHQILLEDVAIDQEIRGMIGGGKAVSQAISEAYHMFIDMLAQTENEFTQERAADLKDVRNRILRCLAGKPEQNLSLLMEPSVVFARELFPSDTATIDRKNVRAIVAEIGGATSHTAIVARSFGIPTVLGVAGVLSCVTDGEEVIVDAAEGLVILRADKQEKQYYQRKQLETLKQLQTTNTYRDVRAVTKDGTAVAIEVNISAVDALSPAEITAADGVGLMRSEFLFMQSKEKLPGEELQYKAYKTAAEAFGGKPVILRTLDIGGDKQLPYMELPTEENPFLGKRGLRFCLEKKEIFRTQLRAALRASQFGDLRIMFPMVGSLDDFRQAKAFVQTVMKELDGEGVPYNKDIKLGIMIEIPSVALIADKAAKEVDFASIGTNDLCQYLMAADRMNQTVAAYYQNYHPAVFRLIKFVAEQFSKYGKPLSVCGEMGGNPRGAIALVGFGLRTLSMSAANMASVKQVITGISREEAERIADEVCAQETAAEAERILTEASDAIVC